MILSFAIGLSLVGSNGAVALQAPKQIAGEQPAAKGKEPIDFARARQLMEKRQRGEKLTADEAAFLDRARAEFQRQQSTGGRDKIGLKPITEMTATDRYKEQDGGLYGAGKNTPPDAHRRAAELELARIKPMDREGRPSDEGRIVLLSISMSNANQEFSTFKPLADADPTKSKRLTIVNGAQGGQAMAEWAPPDAAPWRQAEQRLATAGVSPQQVQVAWIKLANKGPRGDLKEHGQKLENDTRAVIQNAKARFPNLRIAYLSGRIYGGYSTGALNPEPYAYESSFVARWLIQEQIRGSAALNHDAKQGGVKAPLLLWGPYLWADGVTPRQADKLVYTREDLAGDGTHPSNAGREKVAKLLLDFFKNDPLAKPWFRNSTADKKE